MSLAKFLLLAAVGVVLVSVASGQTAPVAVATPCNSCTTGQQYMGSCTATKNDCLNKCSPALANCPPWGTGVITLTFSLVVGLISLIVSLLVGVLFGILISLLSGLYNLLLTLLCAGISILYQFFLNLIDDDQCKADLATWLADAVSQLTGFSSDIRIIVAVRLCVSIVQSFYNECLQNL